ncbi:MAG: hypothetical protein ACOX22_01925 [Caldicoprobacterales bacterium]
MKFDLDGKRHRVSLPVESHRKALIILFQELEKNCIPMESIVGVGHRVVHGGDKYTTSVLINEEVIKTIRELIPIAPLHNSPNLIGIEEAINFCPEFPM